MIDIIELAKKAWPDIPAHWWERDRNEIAAHVKDFAALYRQALIDSGELVEAEKAKESEAYQVYVNR